MDVGRTIASRLKRLLGRRASFQAAHGISADGEMFASEAIRALLDAYDFDSVLDVGSGGGRHVAEFLQHGKRVTAVDYAASKYFRERTDNYSVIKDDYLNVNLTEKYDLVWASHVLEHQINVGVFLKKLFSDASHDGIVAITVPPFKHQVVGGHLTLWNAGLLLYNIILAGNNCKNAAVYSYGYNISVIVPVEPIKELPDLEFDAGDITRLSEFFPISVAEGFDGRMTKINWPRKNVSSGRLLS